MKIKKSWLALILAALMAISVTACSGSKTETTKQDPTTKIKKQTTTIIITTIITKRMY